MSYPACLWRSSVGLRPLGPGARCNLVSSKGKGAPSALSWFPVQPGALGAEVGAESPAAFCCAPGDAERGPHRHVGGGGGPSATAVPVTTSITDAVPLTSGDARRSRASASEVALQIARHPRSCGIDSCWQLLSRRISGLRESGSLFAWLIGMTL